MVYRLRLKSFLYCCIASLILYLVLIENIDRKNTKRRLGSNWMVYIPNVQVNGNSNKTSHKNVTTYIRFLRNITTTTPYEAPPVKQVEESDECDQICKAVRWFLAQEGVETKWNFTVKPKTGDGIDGIFYSKVTQKPLWNALVFDSFSTVHCFASQIVFLVHSATRNFDKRQVLRNLYKYVDERIQILFVIGRDKNQTVEIELIREMEAHCDIIKGDFDDNYMNMTIKLAFGLSKVSKLCKTEFVLKMDDDTFVNFNRVLDNLPNISEVNMSYFGWPCWPHEIHDGKNFNIRLRKYGFTFSDFPFQYATAYAYGFGIILPFNAVKTFVKEYQYVPYVRLVDDFYLGYILARSGFKCCETDALVYIQRELYGDLKELNDVLVWNLRGFSIVNLTDIYRLQNDSIEARKVLSNNAKPLLNQC